MVIAAAAALQAAVAGTASAQNAVTPAPATNATDVGPPQLRDFTLNGTVTRPADAEAGQPARTPQAPAAQAPRTQSSSTTPLPPPRRPAAAAPAPAPAPAAGSMTVELPPPSPSAALPPAGGPAVQLPPSQDLAPARAPDPAEMAAAPSLLPWLLAAVLLGAGAAFYFFRVRARALAQGGEVSQFSIAEPAPAPPVPRPAQPAPAPRSSPPPIAGGGVVASSLRPWLEAGFQPERTIVDDEAVAIEFLVEIYNSGSAPARDVQVEAAIFNASAAQDQQIAAFFANPAGGGERIPVVAPLQRLVVRSVVTMPRSNVRPLLAEGRPLLVPMTALTVLYRWGSNNYGQTSTSYLVGKATKTDKLAPFRLDLGPRVFRGLAAREHQLRVRK